MYDFINYHRVGERSLNTNKMILKYCPNFNRIINFDYYEDDILTGKLINIYEKFIFSINIDEENDCILVRKIDHVLGKYIDDYTFRKELQAEIFRVKVDKPKSNILQTIVENIIRIFDKYQEDSTRKIYISRWI